MARINVDPLKPTGKLLLDAVDQLQTAKARIARVRAIMDRTRFSPDFAALGSALGVSAQEAEDLYGRMQTAENDLNAGNFANMADFDQG